MKLNKKRKKNLIMLLALALALFIFFNPITFSIFGGIPNLNTDPYNSIYPVSLNIPLGDELETLNLSTSLQLGGEGWVEISLFNFQEFDRGSRSGSKYLYYDKIPCGMFKSQDENLICENGRYYVINLDNRYRASSEWSLVDTSKYVKNNQIYVRFSANPNSGVSKVTGAETIITLQGSQSSSAIDVYRLVGNECFQKSILPSEKTELDFNSLEECQGNISSNSNIFLVVILTLIIIGGLIYLYLKTRRKR